MKKLAVIGDRDSVILFKTLGFETVFAEKAEEIQESIKTLINQNTSIIYITEEAAQKVWDIIEKYQYEPFPIFITIPNKNGSTGIAQKAIKANVEKAIGTDILT